MRKGPYLIYPGNNTDMMVLWQLDSTQTCTLQWGLDTSYSDGNTVTTEYGADHQHKHTITALTPSSKYYYRVTIGAEQYSGSFRAAPPQAVREVKFLAYGDTRTNYNDHDMVNRAMVDTFKTDPNYQTFTLLTGDWVDDGEEESDWTNEFFNPSCPNTRELQANLPINGCIGNHEWDDDSSPPTYFDKYWPYPYVDGFYWSFDYGPAHIAVVDQYDEDYYPSSEQFAWLENDLASSTKEWKFVMLHEPGYSAGHHDDESAVQNYIQPLCEQYGVDIVFCGHNHYYARCDKNGVKHITAGGGGAPLYYDGSVNYSEYVEVCAVANHFCTIDIQRNELAFKAVRPDCIVIDEFLLQHPEVNLVGPADGATVDAGGAVFSCDPVPDAVTYQVLFGPDPEHVDYLISDTPSPPTNIITTFPFEQTWWTVRVRNQYGRNFYADPIHINAENVTPLVIENLNTGNTYGYIQHAIDEAATGDRIVVGAGIWQYLENIDFKGKSLTVRSTNPNDPDVVTATVINGGGRKPAVTFSGGERESCVLAGLTITDGNEGIYCSGANPTITNCRIVGNKDTGIESWYVAGWRRSPTVISCTIADNEGAGIMARGRMSPTVINCLVAGNRKGGIDGDNNLIVTNCTVVENALWGISCYNGTITNCIVWENSLPQIEDHGSATSVTYSSVQGGWSGEGNIDADPCFLEPGYWDTNGVWFEGDYHLLSDSACIDAGDNAAVPADTYDLDGDGNTAEPIPWDLDGNARIVDGNSDGSPVVDMGTYEFFVPPIEVAMRFTPQALNPGSQGNWVKAHFVLPEGYMVEDVDTDTPAEIEPVGIQSEYMNVFVNEEGLVEIEAAFGRGEFCSSGPLDGTVTVAGLLTSGQRFVGTDTIKILTDKLRYVAVLASYWLEESCGEPDWCGGLDVDQDGAVNLVDFALFDGCCIEIIPQ